VGTVEDATGGDVEYVAGGGRWGAVVRPARGELELSGCLDACTTGTLAPVLDHLLSRLVCRVVIDLGSLRLIDGEGVRELLRVSRRLLDRGCEVSIEGASGQPRAVLHLLGVADALLDRS
jgi:anti-anti-sigma regulatory factor